MAYITLNIENCKACKLCMESCPKKCITFAEKRNSKGFHPAAQTEEDKAKCTGCKICAIICPDLCIEVYKD